MRIRYAALYITLGVTLGLYLHGIVTLRSAEAEWAAPSSSPARTADPAYA
jgi:hypothetical protein